MKKDLKKVKDILDLRAEGAQDETIKRVLHLEDDVEDILAEYEKRKAYKSAEEVAEMLKQALGNKEAWNAHKVYRLMKDDILVPVDRNAPKRLGYRFKITDVQAYIEERLKTKEQVEEELKELQSIHRVLQANHDALQTKYDALQQDMGMLQQELESLKSSQSKEAAVPTVDGKNLEGITEFNNLTEEEYHRIIYTADALFTNNQELKQEIQQLKEEKEELRLQAGKIQVTKEDRMALRGLGISVGCILKNVSIPKEETVHNLVVKEMPDVDKISVAFRYKGEWYKGIVQPGKHYSSNDIPKLWELTNVIKIETSRHVRDKKVRSFTYDVLYQTFVYLYEKERESNLPFQALY
ncbi:hypothetical protein V7068_19105 [Bacillus sp. JJ634]